MSRLLIGSFCNIVNMEEKVLVISGNQIRMIENNAYRDQDMQHLIISAKVSGIGIYAFKGCSSLHTVELPDGLEIIRVEAFARCTSLKTINIPDSVKKIEMGAFHYCKSLETIRFPDAAVSGCLQRCTSLTSVSVPISLIERGYAEPIIRHQHYPLNSIEIRL